MFHVYIRYESVSENGFILTSSWFHMSIKYESASEHGFFLTFSFFTFLSTYVSWLLASISKDSTSGRQFEEISMEEAIRGNFIGFNFGTPRRRNVPGFSFGMPIRGNVLEFTCGTPAHGNLNGFRFGTLRHLRQQIGLRP